MSATTQGVQQSRAGADQPDSVQVTVNAEEKKKKSAGEIFTCTEIFTRRPASARHSLRSELQRKETKLRQRKRPVCVSRLYLFAGSLPLTLCIPPDMRSPEKRQATQAAEIFIFIFIFNESKDSKPFMLLPKRRVFSIFYLT